MKLKLRSKALRIGALSRKIESVMFVAQVAGTGPRRQMCDNYQTFIGSRQGEPDLLGNLQRRDAGVRIPACEGFPDVPALDHRRPFGRWMRPA